MKTKKYKFKKAGIALLTAFCMLTSGVSYAAPVAAVEAPFAASVLLRNASEFSVPSSIGKIDSWHPGIEKTILHIQTAHGNFQAQKNIQAILEHLQKIYGVKTVLLEGAWDQLDPSILNFLPEDQKQNKAALDALTHWAIVKGPELYLADHADSRGYGIEDKDLYLQNGRDFAAVIRATQGSDDFLSQLDQAVERAQMKYLPGDARAFLKRSENQDSGQLALDVYLRELQALAVKTLRMDLSASEWQYLFPGLVRYFTIQKLEQRVVQKNLSQEESRFLKAVSFYLAPSDVSELKQLFNLKNLSAQLPEGDTRRFFEQMTNALPQNFNYKAYPSICAFIGILILKSEILPESFMPEIEKLRDVILKRMAPSHDAEFVFGVVRDFRLLKKLFALQLLPQDFVHLQVHSLLPSVLARRLFKDGIAEPKDFSHLNELDVLYARAIKFYQGAKQRDQAMLRGIEKRLQETNADKVVVVTGGFHAQPFKKYFESKGYSYGLVTPKITEIDKAGYNHYLETALAFMGNSANGSSSSAKIENSTWETGSTISPEALAEPGVSERLSGLIGTALAAGSLARIAPRVKSGFSRPFSAGAAAVSSLRRNLGAESISRSSARGDRSQKQSVNRSESRKEFEFFWGEGGVREPLAASESPVLTHSQQVWREIEANAPDAVELIRDYAVRVSRENGWVGISEVNGLFVHPSVTSAQIVSWVRNVGIRDEHLRAGAAPGRLTVKVAHQKTLDFLPAFFEFDQKIAVRGAQGTLEDLVAFVTEKGGDNRDVDIYFHNEIVSDNVPILKLARRIMISRMGVPIPFAAVFGFAVDIATDPLIGDPALLKELQKRYIKWPAYYADWSKFSASTEHGAPYSPHLGKYVTDSVFYQLKRLLKPNVTADPNARYAQAKKIITRFEMLLFDYWKLTHDVKKKSVREHSDDVVRNFVYTPVNSRVVPSADLRSFTVEKVEAAPADAAAVAATPLIRSEVRKDALANFIVPKNPRIGVETTHTGTKREIKFRTKENAEGRTLFTMISEFNRNKGSTKHEFFGYGITPIMVMKEQTGDETNRDWNDILEELEDGVDPDTGIPYRDGIMSGNTYNRRMAVDAVKAQIAEYEIHARRKAETMSEFSDARLYVKGKKGFGFKDVEGVDTIDSQGKVTFGMALVEEDGKQRIVAETAFLEQIHAAGNPHQMLRRAFVHLIYQGTHEENAIAEFDYYKNKFDATISRKLRVDVETVFHNLVQRQLAEQPATSDLQVLDQWKLIAKEFERKTRESLWEIGIKLLNGKIKLQRVRWNENDPDFSQPDPTYTGEAAKTGQTKVGVYASALNPLHIGQFEPVLRAIAQLDISEVGVVLHGFEYRKPGTGLNQTFEEREEMAAGWIKLFGGLLRLSKVLDRSQADGETKLEKLIEINGGREGETEFVYVGLGGDHMHMVAPDKMNAEGFRTPKMDQPLAANPEEPLPPKVPQSDTGTKILVNIRDRQAEHMRMNRIKVSLSVNFRELWESLPMHIEEEEMVRRIDSGDIQPSGHINLFGTSSTKIRNYFAGIVDPSTGQLPDITHLPLSIKEYVLTHGRYRGWIVGLPWALKRLAARDFSQLEKDIALLNHWLTIEREHGKEPTAVEMAQMFSFSLEDVRRTFNLIPGTPEAVEANQAVLFKGDILDLSPVDVEKAITFTHLDRNINVVVGERFTIGIFDLTEWIKQLGVQQVANALFRTLGISLELSLSSVVESSDNPITAAEILGALADKPEVKAAIAENLARQGVLARAATEIPTVVIELEGLKPEEIKKLGNALSPKTHLILAGANAQGLTQQDFPMLTISYAETVAAAVEEHRLTSATGFTGMSEILRANMTGTQYKTLAALLEAPSASVVASRSELRRLMLTIVALTSLLQSIFASVRAEAAFQHAA